MISLPDLGNTVLLVNWSCVEIYLDLLQVDGEDPYVLGECELEIIQKIQELFQEDSDPSSKWIGFYQVPLERDNWDGGLPPEKEEMEWDDFISLAQTWGYQQNEIDWSGFGEHLFRLKKITRVHWPYVKIYLDLEQDGTPNSLKLEECKLEILQKIQEIFQENPDPSSKWIGFYQAPLRRDSWDGNWPLINTERIDLAETWGYQRSEIDWSGFAKKLLTLN